MPVEAGHHQQTGVSLLHVTLHPPAATSLLALPAAPHQGQYSGHPLPFFLSLSMLRVEKNMDLFRLKCYWLSLRTCTSFDTCILRIFQHHGARYPQGPLTMQTRKVGRGNLVSPAPGLLSPVTKADSSVAIADSVATVSDLRVFYAMCP